MKNSLFVILSMEFTPHWAFARNDVVLINQSTVAAGAIAHGSTRV